MNNTNGRYLKDLYKDYFKIGTAVAPVTERTKNSEIGNPPKEELVLEQFSSITFENQLKPETNMGIGDAARRDDYVPFVINSQAKYMLDWAVAHDIKVRGHVMVWHSQCPREIFCKDYKLVTIPTDPELLKEKPFLRFFEKLDPVCFTDRETLLKRLESYIYSLTEYMYKNGYMKVLYAWDVVNEAIEVEDKQPTGLRNSYWYQIIGDDFIYWAFKFANEADEEMAHKYADVYGIDANDENALSSIRPILFYNDYNEFQPAKKDAIIAMLKREGHGHGSILGENLIGGIGMQGHISDNNDIEEFKTALLDYSALVKNVHITELDIKCTCKNVNREYYQAVFYKRFFEMLVEERKKGANLTCVTLWGLTDETSWIRDADPLLFKGDLTPKKAFDAVCFALTGGDLGEPEKVSVNLSDRKYDFEGEETLEELGFSMKGPGQFEIQEKEVHSGKKAIGNPMRFDDWAAVTLDISDFIGQTIAFSAWVKSVAPKVAVLADMGKKDPVIGSVETGCDEWKQISCTAKLPMDAHSMNLSFFTQGEPSKVFSPIFIDDVEIKLVGMEESFEEESNIAGIRGAGHLPVLTVTDKESVDGNSKSLMVTRAQRDATVKFNVSPYIGYKANFRAFVKTTDKVIKAGLDGAKSIEFASVEAKENGWTEISFDIELQDTLNTAEIYIETDGNADMYIDDILVTRK